MTKTKMDYMIHGKLYVNSLIELSDVGDFDSDNLNDLEEFKFGTNQQKLTLMRMV